MMLNFGLDSLFEEYGRKEEKLTVQKSTCQMNTLPIQFPTVVTLVLMEINYYLLINVKREYGWTVYQSCEGNSYGQGLRRYLIIRF
jgi:hypothetical protein